ncbi:MATE family efflux transporter [Butyrivibrio sp. AE2032]|uniref:MATE family efflux transporter n=1 Tax=Butyrivibrio sp. AE2032 TaxID=1458463 RepID=UPI0005560DFF|nr:MATE family efflux transporter [Butyrivibrio sp. AE2032]
MKKDYFEQIRNGSEIPFKEQLRIIVMLSIPAIFSQITTVIMEYVDQSMVGRLGPDPSAAIGLVSSTTWLVGGICRAVSTGFNVQVAHSIGAKNDAKARAIVKHGLVSVLAFSITIAILCVSISAYLPYWLGGGESIASQAATYFRIFAFALPLMHISMTSSGMLQCSGNIRTPSILSIIGCFLNVILNFILIFPTRSIIFFGTPIVVYGAGLGVAGAALGTALSEGSIGLSMLYFLLVRSPLLHLRKEKSLPFTLDELGTAVKIAVPVGIEQGIMGCGYVMATRIVSPLGNISLAANSFSITAEGLCYMPGYGIASAATALIGQSLGAGRKKLANRLGWLATALGMLVMTGTGILMYIFAPQLLALLTPDPEIQALGAMVLRIEAFAEPMFAASIVGTGVFRGAGDTLGPSVINFISMWAVRITLASFLAPRIGLRGVWLAMCIDICVRGALFLLRLYRKPVGSATIVKA